MNLSTCVACKLPVLELDGQFDRLDSFFIRDGVPPAESAGHWHTSCLRGSNFGRAWREARLANYCGVRGFLSAAETAGWTVLRDPRGGRMLAIGRTGELFDLSIDGRAGREVEGGIVTPRIEEQFHLEIPSADVIQAIKDGLQSMGTYPLTKVLLALQIADRVVHSEALTDAMFRFDPSLQQLWQRFSVSARCDYGLFVPNELLEFIGNRLP